MTTFGDLLHPEQAPSSATARRLTAALGGLPDNGYRSVSASWRDSAGHLVTMTLSATREEEPPPAAAEDEESD